MKDKKNTAKYGAAVIGVIALATTSANATVIASDDFNTYTDGNIVGQAGAGTGWSTDYTGADGLNVTSGQIDGSGAPEQVYRGLSQTIDVANGNEVWMTFDGQITLSGSFGYAGVSFFDGGSEKGIIGAISGRDMFGIGGADTGVTGTNSIAVKFDLTDNSVSLWTGTAGSAVDVSGAPTQTGSMNIKGTDNLRFAIHTGDMQIDNFIMGTTMEDVNVVPEPSSAALLGLSGLALILRRKK